MHALTWMQLVHVQNSFWTVRYSFFVRVDVITWRVICKNSVHRVTCASHSTIKITAIRFSKDATRNRVLHPQFSSSISCCSCSVAFLLNRSLTREYLNWSTCMLKKCDWFSYTYTVFQQYMNGHVPAHHVMIAVQLLLEVRCLPALVSLWQCFMWILVHCT